MAESRAIPAADPWGSHSRRARQIGGTDSVQFRFEVGKDEAFDRFALQSQTIATYGLFQGGHVWTSAAEVAAEPCGLVWS
jgi:hypothetical protein